MQLRYIPRETSRFVRQLLGMKRKNYWQRRRNLVYLREVRILVNNLARDAQSILDVGSNGCPYLEWFDWIPRRVSIDIRLPYSSERVEAVKADFLVHRFAERFDVSLCLQVLEHVPDAAAFAQRLLASARHHVIVSVPYKWAADRSPNHIHDPVDEAKLAKWFGRPPTHSCIVRERRGTERIICHYDVREARSATPVAGRACPVRAG